MKYVNGSVTKLTSDLYGMKVRGKERASVTWCKSMFQLHNGAEDCENEC